MSEPQKLTGSIWFATGIALLVSLGAQTLIEALLPIAALDWLYEKPPIEHVVFVAGKTSFWLVDTLIRALAFALGAVVGCLLVSAHSWRLPASLMAMSVIATVFVEFPWPAAPWQLGVWALAAPAGVLLVAVIFRMRRAAC